EVAPVDQVNRQALALILVDEIAPQLVFRAQFSQCLECECLQAPWPERAVIVSGVFHVHLHTFAKFPHMLMECRFKPAGAQPAALEPSRRELPHGGDQGASLEIGGAEKLEWPR